MSQAEDRLRILDTKSWPRWPKLPMKNYSIVKAGYLPEVGFMLASDLDAGKVIVYRGNIFREYTEEQFNNLPKDEFENVDEMLFEGWGGD